MTFGALVVEDVAEKRENHSSGDTESASRKSLNTRSLRHTELSSSAQAESVSTGAPLTGKAILTSTMQLSERQEMIRIISNRLFVALLLLVAAFMAGALLTWNEIITMGATNAMILLCGAIGGFISVQRRLKSLAQEDLVLLARSWVYVLLSPLVGSILASLLFFLFVSGLLDGDLFPDFTGPENGDKPPGLLSLFSVYGDDYTDYAKLIFWCFLAGYSETFVTNIISKFESGTDDSSFNGGTGKDRTA